MGQEPTSARGDSGGSVNPTRSKVRQEAFEDGPSELPGRPLEAGGNAGPREMVARVVLHKEYDATEPGLQADSSAASVAWAGELRL